MAVDTRATARWLAVDCALGDRWQRVGRSQQPFDYLILADATEDELDQLNRDVQERRQGALEIGPTVDETLDGPPQPDYRPGTFYRGDLVVFAHAASAGDAGGGVAVGAFGIIESVSSEPPVLRVRVDDRVVVLRDDDCTAVRLGYALPMAAARDNIAERVYVVTRGLFDAVDLGLTLAHGCCTLITDSESEGSSLLRL
jgi:hypothetical protein